MDQKNKFKSLLNSLQLKINDQAPSPLRTLAMESNQEFDSKYKIINKIGEGAHGAVHLVKSKVDQLEYAAKEFRTDDEEIISQIKRAFQIQQMTNNIKHFVMTYDLFLNYQHSNHFLIMEYVRLPTLESIIETEIPFSIQLRIVMNLAQAVQYLHAKRICHRDLKPDNILVDVINGDIKLIDFGVSRFFQESTGMSTPTGDQRYRAPEMLTSYSYSEAIDVWALGLVAYQMFVQQKGFSIDLDLVYKKSQRYGRLVSLMLNPDPKERISPANVVQMLKYMPNLQNGYSQVKKIRSISESSNSSTQTGGKQAYKNYIQLSNKNIKSESTSGPTQLQLNKGLKSKIRCSYESTTPQPVKLKCSIGKSEFSSRSASLDKDQKLEEWFN